MIPWCKPREFTLYFLTSTWGEPVLYYVQFFLRKKEEASQAMGCTPGEKPHMIFLMYVMS